MWIDYFTTYLSTNQFPASKCGQYLDVCVCVSYHYRLLKQEVTVKQCPSRGYDVILLPDGGLTLFLGL